ncbi:hypothetical protein GCM10023170_090570 [Phytohabitans houttuyneae]
MEPAPAKAVVTVRSGVDAAVGDGGALTEQVDALARLVLAACVDTREGVWLVEDRSARLGVFAGLWPAVIRYALTSGNVDVAVDSGGDTVGIGIWVDSEREDPDAVEGLLTTLCGRYADRFGQFEAARTTAPASAGSGQRSVRLVLLAVARGRQGQGIGTALLRHRHAVLDRQGVPAYAAATSSGFRDLAVRHGYQPDGPVTVLPHGPSVWLLARRGQPVATEPGDDDTAHRAHVGPLTTAEPGS